MKITIFNNKIAKIFASLFLAVALVGSISVMNNANIAEAKEKMVTITPQKEREYAIERYEKKEAQYHFRIAEKDSPLRQIQDTLVTYNSDKLNYNDGKHERWLEPVGVVEYSYPHGASSSAGVSYMNQQYEDRVNGYNSYDIIRYSDVAAVMAHEFGHFVNKDTLTWVKGYPKSAQRDDEFGADQMGMELLDKVPEYSMGSMVARANGFQGIYPTFNDDLKFLEDWAYGRVKFVQIDVVVCLSVDGIPFTVRQSHNLGASWDASGDERTMYLMGQIASCIHHGMWKKRNIFWGPESSYFLNGRSDCTTLFVYDPNSDVQIKFLATFNITEADIKELTNAEMTSKNCEKKWQDDDFNFIRNWPKD